MLNCMECHCKTFEKHFVALIKDLAEKNYGSQAAFSAALFPMDTKPKQKWYRIYKQGQSISIETACRACDLLDTNIHDVVKQACRISMNDENGHAHEIPAPYKTIKKRYKI